MPIHLQTIVHIRNHTGFDLDDSDDQSMGYIAESIGIQEDGSASRYGIAIPVTQYDRECGSIPGTWHIEMYYHHDLQFCGYYPLLDCLRLLEDFTK